MLKCEPLRRKLADCHCDKREARREIVSSARNQPHAGTVLPRQNAEAVMLDFVDPARPGGRGLRWRRQTRLDNPEKPATNCKFSHLSFSLLFRCYLKNETRFGQVFFVAAR
jgi:hypothetical protein